MKKTQKFWAQATAATLALAFIPASFAFSGFGMGDNNKPDAATRTAIENAMTAGDYAAWKALLPANMQSKVTEAKFKQMTERHTEMEAKRAEMETHRAAVEAAITSGDYAAWKAEVTKENPNSPLLTKITTANFAKFAEMYSYREKAQAIEKELDIEGCCGGMMGKGGMMGGMGMGEGMGKGGMKGMGGKHSQE
jgi:hypothetical protein